MTDNQKVEQLELQLKIVQASLDAEIKGRQGEQARIAELVNTLQQKAKDEQELQVQLTELEDRCKGHEKFAEEAKMNIKRLEYLCHGYREEVLGMDRLLSEQKATQAKRIPKRK